MWNFVREEEQAICYLLSSWRWKLLSIKNPFHVLFVDLVKAYDSVSKNGLWALFRKKGIPPRMRSKTRTTTPGKRPGSVRRAIYRRSFLWTQAWVKGVVLLPFSLIFFSLGCLKPGARSREEGYNGSHALMGLSFTGKILISTQSGNREMWKNWGMQTMRHSSRLRWKI